MNDVTFWVYLRGGATVPVKVSQADAERTVGYLDAAVEGTSPRHVLRWGDEPHKRRSILTSEIVAYVAEKSPAITQTDLLVKHNALLQRAVDSMDSGEEWRGD